MDYYVICQMCGAKHMRAATDDWVYYNGELYCTRHPGVTKWYEGALEIMDEKLRRLNDSEGVGMP
jgi:hypothetical protein